MSDKKPEIEMPSKQIKKKPKLNPEKARKQMKKGSGRDRFEEKKKKAIKQFFEDQVEVDDEKET